MPARLFISCASIRVAGLSMRLPSRSTISHSHFGWAFSERPCRIVADSCKRYPAKSGLVLRAMGGGGGGGVGRQGEPDNCENSSAGIQPTSIRSRTSTLNVAAPPVLHRFGVADYRLPEYRRCVTTPGSALYSVMHQPDSGAAKFAQKRIATTLAGNLRFGNVGRRGHGAQLRRSCGQ